MPSAALRHRVVQDDCEPSFALWSSSFIFPCSLSFTFTLTLFPFSFLLSLFSFLSLSIRSRCHLHSAIRCRCESRCVSVWQHSIKGPLEHRVKGTQTVAHLSGSNHNSQLTNTSTQFTPSTTTSSTMVQVSGRGRLVPVPLVPGTQQPPPPPPPTAPLTSFTPFSSSFNR